MELEHSHFLLSAIAEAQRIKEVTMHLSRLELTNYLKDNFVNFPEDAKEIFKNAMKDIIKFMAHKEASDLEIGGYGCAEAIWIRVQGNKYKVALPFKLDQILTTCLIFSILNKMQIEYLVENKNLDFSFELEDREKNVRQRFRCDAYFDLDEVCMNARRINPQLRKLDTYDFNRTVRTIFSWTEYRSGLILFTGITGMGKSTTLDAIIDWHNHNVQAHIVIIANPVEYVHKSNLCLIRHREVGKDVKSFRDGIVQALRQDLDIMVVGEMRDPETIMAALEITDTGHKVFSTLHTSSAVESLDRIIAEFPPHEQDRVRHRLADVLLAIISQKLIPGIDGKLVLAKEVLVVTPNIRAAIKNNNTSEVYYMMSQSEKAGMNTLEQDLIRLYKGRRISYDTALQFANNKSLLKQMLGAL